VPIQVARHTLHQGHAAAFFAPSVVAHQIAAGTLLPLQVIDLPAIFCESVARRPRHRRQPATASPSVRRPGASEAGDLCVPG
jgi:hypothetical protein